MAEATTNSYHLASLTFSSLVTALQRDDINPGTRELIEIWQSSTEIQDYLTYARGQTQEYNLDLVFPLIELAIAFFTKLRIAINQDISLNTYIAEDSSLTHLRQLLSQEPPQEANRLTLWLDSIVTGLSPIIDDVPEINEDDPLHPRKKKKKLSKDSPTSDTGDASQSQPPSNQVTSNSTPDEAIVAPVVESAVSTTAKVVVPPPQSDTNVSQPDSSSSPSSPYHTISVHNAFARNDVAAKLLQIYELPAGDVKAWDQLSGQMQYLVSRDLQAFLYGLEDTQLQQLNRSQFVELFFQDFRQRHPFILEPQFALKQSESDLTPPVTQTPLTEDAEGASRLKDPEAESAYQKLQELSQKGYLSQDLAHLEQELVQDLKAYGLQNFEVDNLQNLAHYVTALGADPTRVWYGANREELIATFPFLSGQSDEALTEIIGKVHEYTWRQGGLIAKTLERPSLVFPQDDLPSPEVATRILSSETLSPGLAHEESGEQSFSVVVEAALTAGPGDDKYQAVLETVALHTTAAERAANPTRSNNLNQRVFSVYSSPLKRETANKKLDHFQLMAYETALETLEPPQFSLFERRKQYYRQLVFTNPQAELAQFNKRLGYSKYIQAGYSSQELAYLSPYDLFEEMYNAGNKTRRPSQRRRALQDVFNFLRRGGSSGQASPAQAISKTKSLLKFLSHAKQAAEGIKKLAGLTKIFAILSGLVSSLLSFLLGTPLGWLVTGGLSLLGLGSLVSALTTGASNAAPAVKALGQQAGYSLTQGFQAGFPQVQAAEAGINQSSLAKDGNALSKASQGAKEYITSGSPSATTLVGVGGMTTLAVVTLTTINASFYKPLNTEGEVSPYIDIVKEALYEGATFNNVESITDTIQVTYRITITPKENYTLSISDIIDTQSIDFNEAKLEEEGRSAPAIQTETRSYQGGDFPDLDANWPSRPQLNPGESITLEYQQTFTPEYMNSAFFNEVTVEFDARDAETGENITGESASLDHKICFGECPSLGEKCWPTQGELSQLPYDNPPIPRGPGSHAPGEIGPNGLDAFDIAAPATTPIYAPYDGRLCNRTYMADGYGNWVVLDQVSGAPFQQLHFAHMSSTYFDGQSSNACENITRGTKIGEVGSTGNSSGNHLHYAAAPTNANQVSIVRTLVPRGDAVALYDGVGAGAESCGQSGL